MSEILISQKEHNARSPRLRKPQLWYSAILPVMCIALSFAAAAQEPAYRLDTVAEQLRWPWSVAQLPDGGFLVTEREGRLLYLDPAGTRSTVEGTPDTLFAGQGGYFDIALHPEFAENNWIYLSYAEGSEQANGTAIFRARFVDGQLSEGQKIFRVASDKSTPQHYGGRMLFMQDGSLLLTSGEGFKHREEAQALDSELGKILRIDDKGASPPDNPFTAAPSANIWSYGHRNPQGITYDEQRDTIYVHEHGPRGGDELNALEPAQNYGWPAVTHGVDYSGAYVSPFKHAMGIKDPLWTWVPSIAPSGMAWYNGDGFPEWRGSLLIGALVDREVRRLQMHRGTVASEESLFTELNERIRDVRVLGGEIYLLTDSEQGKLIRITPP
jgi:glucose/arabinose dehydrogenase